MKRRAVVPGRGVFHSRPLPSRPLAARAPADGSNGRIELIALNKPHGVICQFSPDGRHPTLADFVNTPDVYPAGRLDTDSEGLLLLTNSGPLQNWISSPGTSQGQTRSAAGGGLRKVYWAQVEGQPDDAALARLSAPLDLGDFITRPGGVRVMAEPHGLWARNPPIRYRAHIPTTWLELTLTEGKNRQVRRMTAAVGFPTLRLIRAAIGPVQVGRLVPGAWRQVPLREIGYAG